MSNTPSSSSSSASQASSSSSSGTGAARASKSRSQTLSSVIERAQSIAAALPALLSGVAKADASAKSVRIDAAWVKTLNGVIAQAQRAQGQAPASKATQRAATATERATSTELARLLAKVRDTVATHAVDDVEAQRAYGRGAKLDAAHTGGILATAQAYLASWNGEWKSAAADAGVTQATMDQVASLAGSLDRANVSQQAKMRSGAQGTLDRDAAFTALRTMSAFAVRVVGSVYGKGSRELASLSDARPVLGKVVARKAATRAKRGALAKSKAAKVSARRAAPGAKGEARSRKAKRQTVAARAAALLARPKASAPKATRGAVKKTATKKARKKG